MSEYRRNCPKCDKEILYKHKCSFAVALKKNSVCRSCMQSGKNNHFFNKKHTVESKQKMSKFQSTERQFTNEQKEQAKQQLLKVTNNRPLYDIWLEKYGKNIADQKLNDFKSKLSKRNSGEGNPMFGKPSPQGSGNGWSGWYNGWFFRSIRELSYMILIIEKNNLSWAIPNKTFRISYLDHAGKKRTYIPDFIINGNKIIEIKPTKLHNSPKVIAKSNAAKRFCRDKSFSYEIVDPEVLTYDQILKLYFENKIKFLPKYDKKFRKRYLNE